MNDICGIDFMSRVLHARELFGIRAYTFRFASCVAKVIDACYARSLVNFDSY